MEAWVWVVLVVLVVIALVAFFAARRKQEKTEALKERFGPEYERTVDETGKRRSAEAELSERERRREKLDIKPLPDEARESYARSWRETQERFVDAPSDAVGEADRLVQQVMRERGYPIDNFEQRAADVSVDHPEVVQDYRAAHAISLANDHGEATTEDLREAMIHYRSLFERLLESRSVA